MALKRKRSSQAFSSPSSDASEATTLSSPMPLFYQQSKPVEPLFHKPTWSFPTYDDHTSQHLNSRTRKRYRDNRPDEQSVYGASGWIGAVIQMSMLADVCRCAANTINKLYEAQRQHLDASPIHSDMHTTNANTTEPTQRSTLHSFWRLPKAPTTISMSIDSSLRSLDRSNALCEDCDKPLRHDDAMDIDEYALEEETSCHACKRRICDSCAVLGDLRICLPCASSGRC
jgi:hypothetical protein